MKAYVVLNSFFINWIITMYTWAFDCLLKSLIESMIYETSLSVWIFLDLYDMWYSLAWFEFLRQMIVTQTLVDINCELMIGSLLSITILFAIKRRIIWDWIIDTDTACLCLAKRGFLHKISWDFKMRILLRCYKSFGW